MERTLTKFALFTRIFIIILQYCSNVFIPDHDAGVFQCPHKTDDFNNGDKIIHHVLGGFIRWDGQYFMHIAKYGYTYENVLAFFPLYPLIVRLIALVIYLIIPLIDLDSIILLVLVSLNVMLFVLCAKILFKLTTIVFNEMVAFNSTILFCVNPASIFFSAPYTECLYCFLTLLSILHCIMLYKKYSSTNCKINYLDVCYLVPISLSVVVRSNGILNIGFLVYTCICISIKHFPRKNFMRQVSFITQTFCYVCTLILICLIPFLIYQTYCYNLFCTNFDTEFSVDIVAYAEKNNFILPGQFYKYNQSWCYDKIPLAYSYVQSHYWNVGFLRYYELKQLPNFILAAPVLFILVKLSCQHIIHSDRKIFVDIFSFHELFTKKNKNVLLNPILNVFVIHIFFLSLFCILFVHIQVSTRMLCSASPILYWFCSSFFKDKTLITFRNIFHNGMSCKEQFILIYFLSYFFIGTVMFCNFLPWT